MRLHAACCTLIQRTLPHFPVSANPAFEPRAPRFHGISGYIGISAMHHHIQSIGRCIWRDCIVFGLLDRPTMKCGPTLRVQSDLIAVHRSTRLSTRLCVNILALAQALNVLRSSRSSLVARPLRLGREPADDVRRIKQPVRENK
jgi:hypothetical protein